MLLLSMKLGFAFSEIDLNGFFFEMPVAAPACGVLEVKWKRQRLMLLAK